MQLPCIEYKGKTDKHHHKQACCAHVINIDLMLYSRCFIDGMSLIEPIKMNMIFLFIKMHYVPVILRRFLVPF